MTTKKKLKERKQAAARQKRRRERLRKMDYKRLDDTFSKTEREQMLAQAKIRGFDNIGEYLSTLNRIDGTRIQHDQKHIGTCPDCKLPLPEGCEAVFKGSKACHYLHGLPLVEVTINN